MIFEILALTCSSVCTGTLGVIIHCAKQELDMINENLHDRLTELEERLKK